MVALFLRGARDAFYIEFSIAAFFFFFSFFRYQKKKYVYKSQESTGWLPRMNNLPQRFHSLAGFKTENLFLQYDKK